MSITQRDAAARLHDLHRGSEPLVLTNAWDAASARIAAAAGARAVATTSAGVAWSLGAADGDQLDRDLAVDLIARVVAAVDLPVSADIESGYGADPAGVADTVTRVLAAGAVGVNLEDADHSDSGPLRAVAEQCDRLAAARDAAKRAGIDLYINARVDTYLLGVGAPGDRLGHTLDRAAAYVAAGADGIFVPGVTDLGIVRQIASALDVPLNVLTAPGAPTVAEFGAAGAARISAGSTIAAAAYGLARRAMVELLGPGGTTSLEGAPRHSDLNALFPTG